MKLRVRFNLFASGLIFGLALGILSSFFFLQTKHALAYHFDPTPIVNDIKTQLDNGSPVQLIILAKTPFWSEKFDGRVNAAFTYEDKLLVLEGVQDIDEGFIVLERAEYWHNELYELIFPIKQ